MLRFFRKIRQSLIENGNTRKYFWYALGEILLVMIGILLALQVNNWNEQRKNNEIKEQYYLSFLEKYKADLIILSDHKEYSQNKLEAVRTLRKQFAESTSNEEAFAAATQFHYPSSILFIDQSLRQAVLNSGEINLFDSELKETILRYWGRYDKYVEIESTNQTYYFEGLQYLGNIYPSSDFLIASNGNSFLQPQLLEKSLTIEALIAVDGALNWLEAKNRESYSGSEELIALLEEIILMLEEEISE